MQNVTVPYGEGSLTFPVDDGIEITRLELNDYPPLADFNAELERVLNHPTGSAPLREKVKAGDKVAIIISDFTRASYRTDALPRAPARRVQRRRRAGQRHHRCRRHGLPRGGHRGGKAHPRGRGGRAAASR